MQCLTPDEPLSAVGYYAIGGRARWVARPRSLSELAGVLDWCRERQLPVIVTGKGSNMLFSDEDFPGVVVTFSAMNRMFWLSERELFCEAGVENTDVSIELQRAGRGGGEWLYRLPGTIGATVRMNGRCYGREISEVTCGVVTAGFDGTVRWRGKEEIFLGYKQTTLMQSPEIVAGALLLFAESRDSEEIGRAMEEFGRDRDAKHQFDFPSCGSTFKNSYAAGRPSGRIFESLGFMGQRVGGAVVSERHANFIFNTGDAKAEEVLRLAAMMRTAAREKEGVDLELEVQCAGLFNSDLLEECGIPSVAEPSRPGFAWTGLLQPYDSLDASFPRMLMRGPMLDYSWIAGHFPDGISVEVEQLAALSEARHRPERPFIRWTTRAASGKLFPHRPEAPEGSFVDGLWNGSVSELFVGHGGSGSSYLELEATPGGHWVALQFDAPRKRSVGHENLSEAEWQDGVKPFAGKEGFGLTLSFATVEHFLQDGRLTLQCCASLGEARYGLFPWWHEPGKPDFHQPARFCRTRLI
jgi:UDP-N-acetylmuramate dehydrogenase